MKTVSEIEQHSDQKAASDEALAAFARETLTSLERIAGTAEGALKGSNIAMAGVLTHQNSFTNPQSFKSLGDISGKARADCQTLSHEPAIARLVLKDDDGKEQVLFIARASAPGGLLPDIKVASYLSPMGRLAATPIGREDGIPLPGGEKYFEVRERAKLRPIKSDAEWDAKDTILEIENRRPKTIFSLRDAITKPSQKEPDEDILEALFRSDTTKNSVDGVMRSVITNKGLREQPILDEFQDEIFRLPLNTHLAIMGPPGTGKTTTLIKRLAQKINLENLQEGEKAAIGRSQAGLEYHSSSWLAFTPTELLRQYVKEAFAKEQIAASDENIKTWDKERLAIARNTFNILKTATRAGAVLRNDLSNLQRRTIYSQIEWFQHFDDWQRADFQAELQRQSEVLATATDLEISVFAKKVRSIIETSSQANLQTSLTGLDLISEQAGSVVTRLRSSIISTLRAEFSIQLNKDRSLLDGLLAYLGTLTEEHQEADESETDLEDDESVQPRAHTREDAFEAYIRSMRALASAKISKRTLDVRSKNGRIAQWLEDRIPSEDKLLKLGELQRQVLALRRYSNPVKAYSDGFTSRYRRYRRVQLAAGRWYQKSPIASNELCSLEVDLLLYATMAFGRSLLRDKALLARLESRSFALLDNVKSLLKNQILIDEVTDFAPLQIACMAQLCDPEINSFLACGDFNQRVTSWGCRTDEELKWVYPDLNIQKVNITYRHSRQLREFTQKLLTTTGVSQVQVQLPDVVDNEGVGPALKLSATGIVLVDWLAKRIKEIEVMIGSLPSIAILVNSEDDVQPMAKSLGEALAPENIECTACPGGQVVGQDSDVRVFDIQHIKGLEFEAVFFIDVDELAKQAEDLFDKYLYVGTTRAAVYLGLTCSGPSLPPRIAALQDQFVETWPS